MSLSAHFTIYCNDPPCKSKPEDCIILSYTNTSEARRAYIDLPEFLRGTLHLPDKILDLLEISAYVYLADRLCYRGSKDAVEYHSWSRSLDFHIRVRDYDFWTHKNVQSTLAEALTFLTGDKEYQFTFYPGHKTPSAGLFDREGVILPPIGEDIVVLPFSGGLDSLAGVLDFLTTTQAKVCLASHQSQPGTKRTQNRLFSALRKMYRDRVYHYCFSCYLSGIRAIEENQRTRSFLYLSIAFALSYAYSLKEFYVFENGITSLNLTRREDLLNARASRTTHPQSIGRICNLFSLISEDSFTIHLPFIWKTKAEIISIIKNGPDPSLISSTVSCSKTFQNLGRATHCGQCFQCIDRRISAHAISADDYDHGGLYAHDCIIHSFSSGEAKTTAVDYIRQARWFSRSSIDHFSIEYASELADLLEWVPNIKDEIDLVERVWDLCKRHGENVQKGLLRMRSLYEDLYEDLEPDSLLRLVSDREYLKPEVRRLAQSIINIVQTAIPEMFRKNPPEDETDLNIKISALLATHFQRLRSEYPTTSFACARVVPDHIILESDLLVEVKYIREGTSPAKASEGIAADLTKYPPNKFILFLVLDQMHAIPSDQVFIHDIESRGRCQVCILR